MTTDDAQPTLAIMPGNPTPADIDAFIRALGYDPEGMPKPEDWPDDDDAEGTPP